uniref:Uncharacterized protein n=1 Tax=Octopus bimaculoides TaxID=37653 RepID=A0A0L8FJF6_OCTBM
MCFGISKFLQHLPYLFRPYFIDSIDLSIGRCILFFNFDLITPILLNNCSTSAFEFGNVNRLMVKFATSLKGFAPVVSLYSKTSSQNASVLDVFVHLTK